MQTKTLDKTSSNFLNNQNYILGKTEKKKVLIKYFVEKSLNLFLLLLFKLNKFLNSKLFFIITYIIYIFLIFILIGKFTSLLIFIYLSILGIPLFVISYIVVKNNNSINGINYYFVPEKINIITYIFKIIVLISLIFIIIPDTTQIFIFLIVFLLSFVIAKINFLNIFSIVLMIPFLIINFIYYFIYIFLIKGTKGNKIIKNNPNSNLLENFYINNENIIFSNKDKIIRI